MNETSHLDQLLQDDIDLIRDKVSQMADLVERALKESRLALLKGKGKLAYSVMFRDRHIDELEKEIDRLCIEFLVKQQPVASDLRFVYATIKINQELERIGDYAESIAREAVAMRSLESEEDLGDIQAISDIAIPMVVNAMKAFLDGDMELAKTTIRQEKVANDYRDRIYDQLFESPKIDRPSFALVKPLMTLARRFERVADQATNICEEVLYMCTGEYAKHMSDEVCRIIFVDDGRSGFARLAEKQAKNLRAEDFVFGVAGLSAEELASEAIEYLGDQGIKLGKSIPTLEQVPNRDHYRVVVALGEVARAALPSAPTHVVGLCWNVPDPLATEMVEGEEPATYQQVEEYLDKHVRNLVLAITGEKRNKIKPRKETE